MKVTKQQSFLVKPNKNTTVYSYPSGNKTISVALIKVNWRHPDGEGEYFIETQCNVLFYLLKGKGKVIIENQIFELEPEDTISIDSGKKYYIEGNLEYLAATSPAYFPEQNRIVKD